MPCICFLLATLSALCCESHGIISLSLVMIDSRHLKNSSFVVCRLLIAVMPKECPLLLHNKCCSDTVACVNLFCSPSRFLYICLACLCFELGQVSCCTHNTLEYLSKRDGYLLALGLHGELIPMAIPVKLPQQRSLDHKHQFREPPPPQRELSPPPQSAASASNQRSPLQMQPPPPSPVSK